MLTLRLIENPVRFAAPLRRSAAHSLALGGAATAVAVCVGVALLAVACPPRSAAARPRPPLTITAAPPPAAAPIDRYDAAVQRDFAQVQAAVAASAELQAVPSNLSPALADAAAEQAGRLRQRLRALVLEVGQPDCATGDTASTTTVALVGDSHAAMWNPAFQQLADQRHWRL